MNTSFDITDIDCAPKELEDALGVSGRTLFDPSEHPIHVDIWDGKAYVTLAEMIELEGDTSGDTANQSRDGANDAGDRIDVHSIDSTDGGER